MKMTATVTRAIRRYVSRRGWVISFVPGSRRVSRLMLRLTIEKRGALSDSVAGRTIGSTAILRSIHANPARPESEPPGCGSRASEGEPLRICLCDRDIRLAAAGSGPRLVSLCDLLPYG